MLSQPSGGTGPAAFLPAHQIKWCHIVEDGSDPHYETLGKENCFDDAIVSCTLT
jgi:hypothetical protein